MTRRATKEDQEAIAALLGLTFSPSTYESRLQRIVSGTDPASHEWVFEQAGQLIAHILYTQATDADGIAIGYHLAPVSVHPDHQRLGHGSRLIRETLESETLSEQSVFVLGDPAFYERFGFTETDSARCPFDVDNAHFRALRWSDRNDPFTIGYTDAFREAE